MHNENKICSTIHDRHLIQCLPNTEFRSLAIRKCRVKFFFLFYFLYVCVNFGAKTNRKCVANVVFKRKNIIIINLVENAEYEL